ncbi:TraR/DksA C4-type zinc finger protein [Streptomyces sp. NBC_01283]|uniref:TraR/DksA family transcriptional regulator n=1 Tax=Streptomyces sp. NBC_01283 TaxID=2903812 RepID=UPI00352F2DE7|nr:TraR/DksA C4-type zinc finger protein [Streptomyces sp. NBC_01283]
MVAKKTAVHHSASGRSTGEATKKTAAKKTAAKKAVVKKAAAKKAVAKKTVAKVADIGKKAAAGAGEGAAGEAAAAKTAAAAKKAPAAKKTAAKKSAAKKSTAKKTAATAAEGAAQAAETTGATTVVTKKTPGTATAAKKPTAVPKARAAAAEPGELAVRPGEDPWTPEEAGEARAELQSEALRLGSEIAASEDALAGLMRDSGDGAGDDDADTGTKNITREHEMSLAANAREMLEQTERALERLDAGTYGVCENCGNPIGKARMQAFPRATLCMDCKQKQERRY